MGNWNAWKDWKHEQWIKQNGRCHWCSHQMEKRNEKSKRYATKEHLIPLARGGADDPSNCVLACFVCNNQRGDESWKDSQWFKRLEAEKSNPAINQ